MNLEHLKDSCFSFHTVSHGLGWPPSSHKSIFRSGGQMMNWVTFDRVMGDNLAEGEMGGKKALYGI